MAGILPGSHVARPRRATKRRIRRLRCRPGRWAVAIHVARTATHPALSASHTPTPQPAARPFRLQGMKLSPKRNWRAAYFTWAQRHYDRLPPLAREDARRFDEWLYSARGAAAVAGLVLMAALIAWALVARSERAWLPAFGLMLLLVFALSFAGLSMWFAHGKRIAHPLRGAVIVILCAFAGGYLGFMSTRQPDLASLQEAVSRVTPVVAPIALAIAGGLLLINFLRRREYTARARELQLEAQAERAQRLAAEAELRALQAQIEPHFLFNTLSSAQYLAEAGDARAAPLLAEINGLLRETLASTRGRDVAAADEVQRLRHYLAICAIRLGARLQWQIDLPEPLARVRLPAAALLTLAENAIEHGIEPALAGGRVELRAWQSDGRAVFALCNTGVAPDPSRSFGLGLSNLAERLRLQAGPAARLELTREDDTTCARITLPLEPA